MPLNDADPETLRREFSRLTTQKLEVINSIVFQYKWQSFAALGYTLLDLENNTFQVSCISPVGIKLFELTGDREQIQANFVLNELLQRGDLPQAVGEDIRRIYFNLAPLPEAKVKKEKYRIIFTQIHQDGRLKYVFAGPRHLLTQKHYYRNNRLEWSVYYYDYLLANNRLYPKAVILKHRRFGYNLIIRLKEARYNE